MLNYTTFPNRVWDETKPGLWSSRQPDKQDFKRRELVRDRLERRITSEEYREGLLLIPGSTF